MDLIKKLDLENKEKIVLYLIIGFLSGLILGFIFSPIKNGIAIGSYNGANNKFVDSNNTANSAEKSGRKKKFLKKLKCKE